MITTNKDNLSQAISKSSSLGLAGGIAILVCNLLIPATDYLGLPDFLFIVAPAFAVASFVLLAMCFNQQRHALNDEKAKKSIGRVALFCALAAIADIIFLINDILYNMEVRDNTVITAILLPLCDLIVIAAFVLLTYYFIYLKKQGNFDKPLNNLLVIAFISYLIKTVINSYSFLVRVLEASQVVQQGALRISLQVTDIIFILISIPMVLFFLKVRK